VLGLEAFEVGERRRAARLETSGEHGLKAGEQGAAAGVRGR
jgi:hypothetical protein